MEPELLEILREAVSTRQRKEDLDRSIGRAVRRRGLGFEVYIKITSEIREVATSSKIDPEAAAKRILEGKQE